MVNFKLKDVVLTEIGEVKVYSVFLGVDTDTIHDMITKRVLIVNPFRDNDTRPSLGLFVRNEKVYINDFGDRDYYGDVFDFVGLLIGKPRPTGKDFVLVCQVIIEACKTVQSSPCTKIQPAKKSFITYDVIPRKWNVYDNSYWDKYGLTIEDRVRGNVYAVQELTKDGDTIYTYDKRDPAYAYVVGQDRHRIYFQIYFPRRTKDSKYPRFLTNYTRSLHCMNEIDVTQILLITKSRKDTLVLRKLITTVRPDISISITNVASEGYFPFNSDTVFMMKHYFDFIITLVDNDTTGLRFSRDAKAVGLQPILLHSTQYKDASDYVAHVGFNKACKRVEDYCNRLDKYITKQNAITQLLYERINR